MRPPRTITIGSSAQAAGAVPFEVGITGTMGCMTFVGLAYPMKRGPDGWVAGEPTSMAIA